MPNEYLPENIADLHRANGLCLTFSTSGVPVPLSTSSVLITDQYKKIGYAGRGFGTRAYEYRNMLNGRLRGPPVRGKLASQSY
jgi:hypothetical protein